MPECHLPICRILRNKDNGPPTREKSHKGADKDRGVRPDSTGVTDNSRCGKTDINAIVLTMNGSLKRRDGKQ